jgi:hypothetical protein
VGVGGDQQLFEKIKVFFKNQKHEPNIVEITHMCIMHRVHMSSLFACSLKLGMQEHTLRVFFWPFLRVERFPRLHQDKLKNVVDFGEQKCGFFFCILW